MKPSRDSYRSSALRSSSGTVLVAGVLGIAIGFGGARGLPSRGARPVPGPEKSGAFAAAEPSRDPELERRSTPARPSASSPVALAGRRTSVASGTSDRVPPSLDPLAGLASLHRADQVRAIDALVADGSDDAVERLLVAFLNSDDPVLAALTEEALLMIEADVSPALIAAFEGAVNAEQAACIAATLAKLVERNPSMEDEIVDLFANELDRESLDAERAVGIRDALHRIGSGVVDRMIELLADPNTNPVGTPAAAWVMGRVAPGEPELVAPGFDRALSSLLAAGEEAALDGEARRQLREKTQRVAWSVVSRPLDEHDFLSGVVLDNLFSSSDAPQAQSMAWALSRMEGLSESARLESARAILGELHTPSSEAVRQSFVWAVRALAQPGDNPPDAAFDAIFREVDEQWQRYGDDPTVGSRLAWVRRQLMEMAGS